LTYTELTVVPGKIYSFKITAVNVVGEGNQSSQIQIIASLVPGTPVTPIKVSADSSPQITISWAAPAYNGGSPISIYKVYMNGSLVGTTSSPTVTYTQTASLVVGNTYLFTVSAVNPVGEGSQSASVSIIAAQVPSAPSAPTKKSSNASSVEV
jgi:hypothetical protein